MVSSRSRYCIVWTARGRARLCGAGRNVAVAIEPGEMTKLDSHQKRPLWLVAARADAG
jgi:hypothetical protein